MGMASNIRHHIFSLPEGKLFSSRDLLHLGTRCTVDQAIHRMLKFRLIVRICRGVFMRETENGWRPTLKEVAIAKARAFGKELYLVDYSNTASSETDESTFYCSGRSSSFTYADKRIYLKAKAPKFFQKDSQIPSSKSGEILDFSPPTNRSSLSIALMPTENIGAAGK
ncbi:MAG: hypothetical protein K2X27_22805 [Candidatus Obscuribacterales bacterium]|nr:hypothetical protein [Candidatus Obscuribacterales bacterium]